MSEKIDVSLVRRSQARCVPDKEDASKKNGHCTQSHIEGREGGKEKRRKEGRIGGRMDACTEIGDRNTDANRRKK